MGVLTMLSRSFFVNLELIIRNVKLPQQLLSVSKLNKYALTTLQWQHSHCNVVPYISDLFAAAMSPSLARKRRNFAKGLFFTVRMLLTAHFCLIKVWMSQACKHLNTHDYASVRAWKRLAGGVQLKASKYETKLLCQLSSNTKAACENLNFSSQALPPCTSEFSQLEESEIFPQVFIFLS